MAHVLGAAVLRRREAVRASRIEVRDMWASFGEFMEAAPFISRGGLVPGRDADGTQFPGSASVLLALRSGRESLVSRNSIRHNAHYRRLRPTPVQSGGENSEGLVLTIRISRTPSSTCTVPSATNPCFR